MAISKNTFSQHILTPTDDEPTPAVRSLIHKPVQARPEQSPLQPVPVQSLKPEPRTPLDYRKQRAMKENKKYINVLIDEELQSEIKPRMVTRKLTWESLVEGLLRRWLEENPGFKP